MAPPDERKPLALPPPEEVEFERNFLKTVVCELRFPTLLALETEPPLDIRNALKKEYPHYEVRRAVGLQAGGISEEQMPRLSSIDKHWVVTVRPYAISLETSHYTNFEELRNRVHLVASKSLPFLDTDFFTRVGLRYVNTIPAPPEKARDWLNPNLVAALRACVFGDVDSCYQEIRGILEVGNYSLRHGYPLSEEGPERYLLDSDFYLEPVPASELTSVLDRFHLQADSLFQWALPKVGREALGLIKQRSGGD